MTEEEKKLLLIDLCARLPYGVQVEHDYIYKGEKYIGVCSLDSSMLKYIDWTEEDNEGTEYKDHKLIPYLRPMSSLTRDEKEEIEVFIFNEWYQEDSCKIDREGWIEILANYDVSGIDPGFCSDYVDWLNEHHFDYRGLIEKGLALEAPEDMYK